MPKSKLQKEYIRQLAKQVNKWNGCKFDYRLMNECMLIAAYLAIEKMKKAKPKETK
jgi:hypothetical protein